MKGHLEVDPLERCKWRGEEWTRKKTCRGEERMWEETVTTGKSEEHKWETVATRRPVIAQSVKLHANSPCLPPWTKWLAR